MRNLVTLVCAAGLLAIGCDDPDTAPITQPSPTASRLSLTSFPANVLRSGSDVTLTARVTDDQGANVTGGVVGFSTTSGTLSSSSALTSNSGAATVTLSASDAAQVTAQAAGASATIDIPAVAPFTIALSTPSPVFMDGSVFGVDVTPNREVVNPPGPAALTIHCGFGSAVDVTTDRSYRCVFPSAGDFTVQASGRTANGWTTTESARVTAISRPSPAQPTPSASNVTLSGYEVTGGPGYSEWRLTVTAPAPMDNVEFDFGDYIDVGDGSDKTKGTKTTVKGDGNRLTASAQFTYRPVLTPPAKSKIYEIAATVFPADRRPPVTVSQKLQVTVR